MKRTYREILEGCKYYQESIKGKGTNKRIPIRKIKEKPSLPNVWNRDFEKLKGKDEKDHE